MTKVIILGGGIAGMTAAHELVERGFEVEVYELKDIPGGKARSINVPNSAAPGKKPLPGEHGFRFFPGFYRHVTDTMKRIPYKANRQGVFGNLVIATRLALARHKAGKDPIVISARFPRNFTDFELILKVLLRVPDLELRPGELEFFCRASLATIYILQRTTAGRIRKTQLVGLFGCRTEIASVSVSAGPGNYHLPGSLTGGTGQCQNHWLHFPATVVRSH